MSERWDGNRWSVVASPNPADSTDDELLSVACASATSCLAVGTYGSNASGTFKTLAERWDGNRWSIVASPNPTRDTDNALADVWCLSASNCMAVGVSAGVATLTERWNGTRWSIVPSPSIAGDATGLLGVSCTTASFCIAVGARGHHGSDFDTDGPMAELWNGNRWSILTTPSKGDSTEPNQLSAVSCRSATNCVAVGYFFSDGAHTFNPLVERWNGNRWSVVASPPKGNSNLIDVSCPTATDCLTSGSYHNGAADRPLIERGRGSSWSILPISLPTSSTYDLLGISCTSVTNCFAVGDRAVGGASLPFVERYS